ncbi:hypothetical protein TELCIR_10786 [Teladorsagia circumcincta]|uniref:Uncharacterized protein n=1 Tax=Teladorsagia circumcincta TaxID=45464 RepID=A0A2G9UCK1_TELCI|nr:hypothetical protein TELCIR_10786 [Teladorsagia circumcincta]
MSMFSVSSKKRRSASLQQVRCFQYFFLSCDQYQLQTRSGAEKFLTSWGYGSQVKIRHCSAGERHYWFYKSLVGKSCLFEEARRIKGKNDLPKRVKQMYNIGN